MSAETGKRCSGQIIVLAPVMLIDDVVHAKMTIAGAKKLLDELGVKATRQPVA